MLTTSPTGHASWSVFRSSGLQKAVLGAVALAALGLGSCSPSGGTGDAKQGGDADLVELLVGRLVDVYGLRAVPNGGMDITLFEADVVIGPDIQDERDSNSTKRDSEIEYDFIGVDPETLQQKLLIPREVGSKDFQELFDKVDDIALSVAAASYGQDTKSQPYTIVPRNCGFELRFSKDLGVTEDFFLAKDANGKVTGIKNPEAVQLLEIRGDPRDNQHVGDFRLIGARIAYKGNKIILDPVILGAEGRNLNLPNTAKGLPQSPNSIGSNIRLALTLEGPLRLRGLRAVGSKFGLVGTNLAARQSIIRDFRSGNASDNNLHTSNGFVNDATPPRVVGEMSMRLERVDIRGPFDQRVLLYKAGIEHEVDRGDVLKLYSVNSEGQPVGTSEVVADPIDDFNRPEEQHVVVRVRDASKFLELDPSTHPDYPGNIKEREAWLVKNAPTIVLSTEFNGEKDDPLNFLSFSPRPIPDPDKDTVAQNRNVSPGASLIVRFTKPVDLGTVRSFDSLILATLEDTVDLLSPKEGTPHLIQSQVFDEDGSQTALRSAPPLGFYVDDEMRKPANKDRYPYFMHLVGGINGIRDLGGRPLDFQFFNKAREFVSFSFHLDVNRDKSGRPRFPNSRVVTLARRFLDKDEDEDAAGELDAFGAIVYQDGQVSGRPTSRLTAFVDDRNQLPSPPTPPLAYCPGGTTATLTGATPFGSPIQNPLNPLGGRLQTIWREVDLSLSRTDPYDFNLDCEGMWWAPFQATNNAPKTQFDIFDRISLYVGHSERRPAPCVGVPSSLPQFGSSGLRAQFFANFVKNHKRTATNPMNKASVDTQPDPHLAYVDQQLVIRNEDSVFEPNGVNRFLPLPAFQDPLFTW
ncbi:MAG: hypothetical protein QGG14_03120, partial [Planctomycetota bacterium]|nr:hypothetical protein [Planctomycetota bacterium]